MNHPTWQQNWKDWLTQQWVIFCGKNYEPDQEKWLHGPFGQINEIGQTFIEQLSSQENLVIERNRSNAGLLPNINLLNLPKESIQRLSPKVIDFYEHTSNYDLMLTIQWNPFFKPFGFLVNQLFSKRINQLNIPIRKLKDSNALSNEIIQLSTQENHEIKHTIWLRKFKRSDEIVYAGIYTTCTLPSGTTCIKAIFPLPNGSATVLLKPEVGPKGELILTSAGRNFTEAGFYFLLVDSKKKHWANYVKSFTEKLIVSPTLTGLEATQKLKLWGLNVANFTYTITLSQFD